MNVQFVIKGKSNRKVLMLFLPGFKDKDQKENAALYNIVTLNKVDSYLSARKAFFEETLQLVSFSL